ncbi:hypothetical protein ZWY2020_046633 [Hordeum vulgare]|nr:hypothetical protein ZWY2020_046633 [Hordeum vulgare]
MLAGTRVAPASPPPPSLADDEPAPSSPDVATATSRKRRRSSGVGVRWAMAVSGCGKLKAGMESLRLRLAKLETECSGMWQDIRKLGGAAGKDGWAARVQRMFSLKMKL